MLKLTNTLTGDVEPVFLDPSFIVSIVPDNKADRKGAAVVMQTGSALTYQVSESPETVLTLRACWFSRHRFEAGENAACVEADADGNPVFGTLDIDL